MDIVKYTCTPATYRQPPIDHPVHWLDWEKDFEIAREFWGERWHENFAEIWKEARELGYEYAAVVLDGRIVARAAAWHFSDEAWDLAAVYTREVHQRRGYGRAVCAFVTEYILASGRTATCHTRADNAAMQGLAESLGFVRVE